MSFPATIELSSLGCSTGFTMNGVAADDWSGWSVAPAGDIDGDGFADLIVGAPRADADGSVRGRAAWCSARRRALPPAFDLSGLDGSNGSKPSGAAAYGNSGFSV